jgi:hypothetical protein
VEQDDDRDTGETSIFARSLKYFPVQERLREDACILAYSAYRLSQHREPAVQSVREMPLPLERSPRVSTTRKRLCFSRSIGHTGSPVTPSPGAICSA